MRAFLWASLLAHVGCSAIYSLDGDDGEGDAGTHKVDAAAPGDDVFTVVSTVGAGGAFATFSAWERARQGNLSERAVFTAREATGVFPERSEVTSGACSATVAPTRESGELDDTIHLDNATAGCVAGVRIETGLGSVELGDLQARGVTERAAILDGTYSNGWVLASEADGDPWVTDAAHRIAIVAAERDPNLLTAGQGVVIEPMPLQDGVIIAVPHTTLAGLEITGFGTSGHEGVVVRAAEVVLERLLFHSDQPPAGTHDGADAIAIVGTEGPVTVRNSAIHHISRAAVLIDGTPATVTVQHVTIHGCLRRLNTPGPFGCLAIDSEEGGQMIVQNSIVFALDGMPAVNAKAELPQPFAGSFALVVDVGDDSPNEFSIPSVLSGDPAAVFEDAALDGFDLHLSPSPGNTAADFAPMIDDPGLAEDIDGDPRSGAASDMGADEISNPG